MHPMFDPRIASPIRSACRTQALPLPIDPCGRPTGALGVVDGLVSVTLQAWGPGFADIGADPQPPMAPL